MSHKFRKGKILSCEPDPAADARKRSIGELLKKIAQEWFLDAMTPEERTQYIEDSRRLTGISHSAIRRSISFIQ